MTKTNKESRHNEQQVLIDNLADLPSINMVDYYADILLSINSRQLIINIDVNQRALSFCVHESPNASSNDILFLSKVTVLCPKLDYYRNADLIVSNTRGYDLSVASNFKVVLAPYTFAFRASDDGGSGHLIMLDDEDNILESIVIGLQAETPRLSMKI